MGELYVDFGKINNSNEKLPRLESRMSHIGRSVYRLHEEVPAEISERYHIGQRLESLGRDIDRLAGQIEKLYKVTNDCVKQYEEAEYENEMRARSFY